MHHIAFMSPFGGTGQTTLIANLATLLPQQDLPCLAVDLCAQNSLGLHLGLQLPARPGWAAAAAAGQWWAEAAIENSYGVGYLPFGEASAPELETLHSLLEQRPLWLKEQLLALEFDQRGLVLLDVPAWPSVQARQALTCADMIIVCLDASVRTCKAQKLVQSMLLQAQASTCQAVVITAFDPRRNSQCEAIQTLRRQWAELLIPYAVHQDENIPEALVKSNCVSVLTPHAQSAHDMQGIANWVAQHCTINLEATL